jgi:hypothetical protein
MNDILGHISDNEYETVQARVQQSAKEKCSSSEKRDTIKRAWRLDTTSGFGNVSLFFIIISLALTCSKLIT